MRKIILASSSPRRKEILSKYNIDIEVISSNINEIVFDDEEPIQVAMSLAFQKAYDIASKHADTIVLAADTIVYKEKILGKPKNKIEACQMLKVLSGETHQVITGIAIINKHVKLVDYEISYVKFKELSTERIERYIATGEYKDKAGAYGIQGYGELLVDWIEGSYSNIVGLPISKIDNIFKYYFNIDLL